MSFYDRYKPRFCPHLDHKKRYLAGSKKCITEPVCLLCFQGSNYKEAICHYRLKNKMPDCKERKKSEDLGIMILEL
jgi:hypothetical protein